MFKCGGEDAATVTRTIFI